MSSLRLTSVLVCRPGQRTGDDLEIIYDELLHIKALAHLSNTVSRLACFPLKQRYKDGGAGLRGAAHRSDTSMPNSDGCLCGNSINPEKRDPRKNVLSSQNQQIIEHAWCDVSETDM